MEPGADKPCQDKTETDVTRLCPLYDFRRKDNIGYTLQDKRKFTLET